MNKILLRLLVATCFFFSSCEKKTREVHFSGRAYVTCDGSPVRNEEVKIYVNYTGGMSGSGFVTSALTDENGNYSVTSDVEYEGTIDNYWVFLSNGQYTPNTPAGTNNISGNTGDSRDVHWDLPSYQIVCTRFHIKNVAPFDANDVLTGYYYSTDSTAFTWVHALDLHGAAVDTFLTDLDCAGSGKIYYKFTYTKNNIALSTPVNSFEFQCRSVVEVYVPY